MLSSRFRFLKAYGLTFVVFSSYLLVWIQKKFLGEAWAVDKMAEVHRRNAQRIERGILELKGLFIKVGQMLSIMTNFLPEALTEGLQGLQDAVPPHPYEAIEKRFLQEFGKRPDELVLWFSREPIASASLGQVHVAYLNDGRKVAIKVQYPEIDEVVRVDLKTLRRLFGLLHLLFPAYGLKHVYDEIREVILRELDYLQEGKGLEQIQGNFKGEKDFLFPNVHWELSTAKILTLQFMEGVKVSSLSQLAQMKVNPGLVAAKIIHGYCKQIFVDGIYHADPHPGNLLIQTTASEQDLPMSFKVVMVDFGATARISDRMRNGISLFAEGLIKRDTRVLAQAVRDMGFVARNDSFEAFDTLVEYFYDKISNLKVENFKNINLSQLQNLETLLDLKKVKISFKDLMTSFHVPRDWILLERTLLLVMGLCAHLDSSLNPIDIVLPYVERFVLKDKPLSEVALALTKELAVSYLQLPHEIRRTLQRFNEGKIDIKSADLRRHTEKMYVLGHQILYGVLGMGSLTAALYLQHFGRNEWSSYGFYGAGLFAFILLVSFIRNRK